MKEVTLNVVLKRIFIDRIFFESIRKDFDGTMVRYKYQLPSVDENYLKELLTTKLDVWAKRSFSEMIDWINAIITATETRFGVTKGGIPPPPPPPPPPWRCRRFRPHIGWHEPRPGRQV